MIGFELMILLRRESKAAELRGLFQLEFHNYFTLLSASGEA